MIYDNWNTVVLVLVIIWGDVNMTSAAPTSRKVRQADTDVEKATKYLMDNHFLGEKNPNGTVKQMEAEDPDLAFVEALKNAQMMYAPWNITASGVLDDETMKLMQMPRCGMPDMVPEMMMKRKKRYLLQGGTWRQSTLTWKVSLYPGDGDLTEAEVDQEMERSLKVWADVSPLSFVQLPKTDNSVPDIDIWFVDPFIDHGDGNPFDGPSGTLAHAFFPGQGAISGDSHFDEAELWTIGTSRGINLFQVAAHEFGHALGLGHSMEPDALMAPFYQGYVPNFQLPQDDILGIQAKYGLPLPSTNVPTTTTTMTTPEPLEPDVREEMDDSAIEFCNAPSFDAITTVPVRRNGYRTFAFWGDVVFALLNDGSIADGYPRPISTQWPGLPNDIDAAVFWDAETIGTTDYPAVTYIFKGNNFWSIDSDGVLPGGYPRSTSLWGLPDSMGTIDAVYKWGMTGRTYFVSGDQYWVYVENYGAFLPNPRPLSNWGDFQGRGVDAVFHSFAHNQLAFFSGDQFHLFDDSTLSVQEGYPRNIVPNWVSCPGGGDQTGGAASVFLSEHSTFVVLYICAIVSHLLLW